MNGETDVDTGLMMIEDEEMTEKESSQKQDSPSGKQSPVIKTGKEPVRAGTPDEEIGKEGLGLSELDSAPVGSSEGDKMISYVPPLKEVKILQFEDELSEEDHKNFNLIYESLLLEGKAGNLTDLTLGMVLAEKPLTGLQVMHERLKHLIISSEMLPNTEMKTKMVHDAIPHYLRAENCNSSTDTNKDENNTPPLRSVSSGNLDKKMSFKSFESIQQPRKRS